MSVNRVHQNTEAGRRLFRNNRRDHRQLSHILSECANRRLPRVEFLEEILNRLVHFSGCDAVALWVIEGDKQFRCEKTARGRRTFRFKKIPLTRKETGEILPALQDDSALERLAWDVLFGAAVPPSPVSTANGCLWIADAPGAQQETRRDFPYGELWVGTPYKSMAMIPLVVGKERIGLLLLESKSTNFFTKGEIESYERVAQTLGVALTNQRAQAALFERVKELTCLYSIAQVAEQPDLPLEEILRRIVHILPPAWQYHEVASSRITFDDHTYSTPGAEEAFDKQAADIVVGGRRRGSIEVVYGARKPELDEGPFLKEERHLIDNVARQVALIIERREAEKDKLQLQDQLRHADRLATIGQLAAGVAHELNEPLSSILGFAQLARKSPSLEPQLAHDLRNIISASLYTREIVKKLMLFARQTPPTKTRLNLNQVVKEGLYFLKSRCAKMGIDVGLSLSPDLPKITADPAQINQVVVNLVVNAIQAMPRGGKLTLQTRAVGNHVSLIVVDTGIGMTEKIKRQIFIPFFTTKDVDEGTGIGLAVVHGIVTAHKGSIKVDSEVGLGTQFEIQLPIAVSEDMEENIKNGS